MIGLIITALVILGGVIATFAVMGDNVIDNSEHLEKHDGEIKTLNESDSEFTACIREFRVELKYIRKGVDDIQSKLK